jgi:hypothetical protein
MADWLSINKSNLNLPRLKKLLRAYPAGPGAAMAETTLQKTVTVQGTDQDPK